MNLSSKAYSNNCELHVIWVLSSLFKFFLINLSLIETIRRLFSKKFKQTQMWVNKILFQRTSILTNRSCLNDPQDLVFIKMIVKCLIMRYFHFCVMPCNLMLNSYSLFQIQFEVLNLKVVQNGKCLLEILIR